MPEEGLDVRELSAGLEEPGGVGVPEFVRRDFRVAPAQLGRFVDRLSRGLSFADYDRLARPLRLGVSAGPEVAR